MVKKIIFALWIGFSIPAAALADNKFAFQGHIDVVQKEFVFKVVLSEESSVALRVVPATDKDFHFSLNLDHVQTPLMLISTVLEGNVEIKGSPQNKRSIAGHVESRYTLVNSKPIEEMAGIFTIQDNILVVESLLLGYAKIGGRMGLKKPFPVELTVELTDVPMEDFLWFWTSGGDMFEELDSSGLVSGKITAAGTLDNLLLQGELSSYSGHVNELAFDSIFINLEGVYPNVDLYNSNVTETSGFTFTIDGSLNLEDKENFPNQLTALTKAPLVNEDPSQIEWTFKRIQKENSGATTDIKYLLRKDQTGEAIGEESSDMFGIERRIGF